MSYFYRNLVVTRSALSRLNDLVGISEQQRDRWLHFAGQRRWLAQSEVKRFIAGCPANRPGSDLGEFMARHFTGVATGYIEPERLSLLASLDGRDLPELAKRRNEEFLYQELDRSRAFFASVENNPLTDEQMDRGSDEAGLVRVFRTFLSHVKSNRSRNQVSSTSARIQTSWDDTHNSALALE